VVACWVARGGAAGRGQGGGQVVAGARGRNKRDTRGERFRFWVKFDGVHVAHEFNIRTWVPTLLIR
jgi:hypothetical protein